MKNIHLLRTNLSRLYYSISMSGYNLKLSERPISKSSEVRPQHIYITNDEEIKDGDWMIRGNEQPTLVTPNFFWDFGVRYYKIILTTDQDLIKDGVQAINDEFVEWFVKNPSCEEIEVEEEDYSQKCRECGEVVKRGYSCNKGCFMKSGNFIPTDENSKYKIIIPKEEPKDVILGYKTSLDAQMLDKVGLEELPQETTLEEIAKKVYPDNIVQISPTFFHNTADIRRHDFIQGYNLHKGELYSEDDLKSAFFNGGDMKDIEDFNHWFEQHKKK